MTRSVNKVILIGTLGRDAETKHTPNGNACTKFSLATNYRYKQSDGDWKDQVDWHNIVLWRAEALAPYLLKGKQVYIEGRLQTRSYEKDGEKRYSTEIVAEQVILLGGGQGGGERKQSQQRYASQDEPRFGDGSAITDDDVGF